LSLLALILTQVLSIVFFYIDTAERPVADPKAIEISITTVLFLLNVSVLLSFVFAFVSEGLGFRKKLRHFRKKIVRIVTVQDVTRNALNSENAGDGFWWHHPSGIATSTTPQPTNEGEGLFGGIWNWHHEKAGYASSPLPPELLEEVQDIKMLAAGDQYYWMDSTTHKLSEQDTRWPDVEGAACCCGAQATKKDDEVAAATTGDIEMVNNPARGGGKVDRAAAAAADDDDEEEEEEAVGALLNPRDEIEMVNNPGREDQDHEQDEEGGARIEEAEVDDALPHGWSEHVSPEGDVYYQNDHTIATTWDKPTLPAVPEGWSVLVDESNDGQHYYRHNATGNSQWEHPRLGIQGQGRPQI
jgi:hypothetical protein